MFHKDFAKFLSNSLRFMRYWKNNYLLEWLLMTASAITEKTKNIHQDLLVIVAIYKSLRKFLFTT